MTPERRKYTARRGTATHRQEINAYLARHPSASSYEIATALRLDGGQVRRHLRALRPRARVEGGSTGAQIPVVADSTSASSASKRDGETDASRWVGISPDEFIERLVLCADVVALGCVTDSVFERLPRGPSSLDIVRLGEVASELERIGRELPLPHLRRAVEEETRLLSRVDKYADVLVSYEALKRRRQGVAAEVRKLSAERTQLHVRVAYLKKEEAETRAQAEEAVLRLDHRHAELAKAQEQLLRLELAAGSLRAEVVQQIGWRDQLKEEGTKLTVVAGELSKTKRQLQEELGTLERRGLVEGGGQPGPLPAPAQIASAPAQIQYAAATHASDGVTNSERWTDLRAALARPASTPELSKS